MGSTAGRDVELGKVDVVVSTAEEVGVVLSGFEAEVDDGFEAEVEVLVDVLVCVATVVRLQTPISNSSGLVLPPIMHEPSDPVVVSALLQPQGAEQSLPQVKLRHV